MRSLLLVALPLVLAACVSDSPVFVPGTDAGPDTGVPLGPNDVTGLLTDAFGSPLAATKVMVDGTVVISDADGKFLVRNVAKKYDVLAPGKGADGSPLSASYLGLRTRTPVIHAAEFGPKRRISVLTHLTDPTGGAKLFGALVSGGLVRPTLYSVVNPSTVGIGLADWGGAQTVSAALLLFSGTISVDGELQKCSGYSRTDLDLADGSNVQNTVTLAPTGCHTLNLTPTGAGTGTVVVSAGLIVDGHPILLQTSGAQGPVNTAMTVRVPDVPGTKAYVMAQDTLRVRPNADAYLGDFAAIAPLTVSVPADGATSASLSTVFAWDAYPTGAMYRLVVGCIAGGATVYTANASAQLPSAADLKALDSALPNGQSCTWFLEGRTAYSSADDWVAPTSTYLPSEDGSYPSSPQRTISFAP